MTLTELIDAVYTLTNRPDLTAETQLAVQSATLKMHHTDFYYKDIAESQISLPYEAYLVQLDTKQFDRYRAFSYIRKFNPTGTDPLSGLVTGTPGDFIKILVPAQVLDEYGVDKTNIAYVAGSSINIRSSGLIQYLLAGWYRNPVITPVANYESWIAVDHPFSIIFDAASQVFKSIGFDEQARKYDAPDGLVAQQIAMIKLSNIQAVGY